MRNAKGLLIVAAMLSMPVPCFGDGVAFSGSDYRSLKPVSQDAQQALISYNNGVEKMLITVALPLKLKDSAVWIFPVFGNPENVKVDLVDSVPQFRGRNPLRAAYNAVGGIVIMQSFALLFPLNLGFMPSLATKGVNVFDEMDRWGIHTETIRADSLAALSEYLSEKKTIIDPEQLKAFEPYLSGQYVLVVSWLSSTVELLKQFPEYELRQKNVRWPCLYVEFPSETAFYPMRPTAAYENMSFSLRIVVLGYVDVLASKGLVKWSHRDFYRQDTIPKGMQDAFTSDFERQKGRYTAFEFVGDVNTFTDDLVFQPVSPRGVLNAEVIEPLLQDEYVILSLAICSILLMSYLSAGLAGLLLFHTWRGYAILGLANPFGIIGLWIASHFIKGTVRERFTDKSRPYARASFLIVFAVVYILLSYAIVGIGMAAGNIMGL